MSTPQEQLDELQKRATALLSTVQVSAQLTHDLLDTLKMLDQELQDRMPKPGPPPTGRRVWTVPSELTEDILRQLPFPENPPPIGIAYHKAHWTRARAWESAQRAWTYLRKEGRVPDTRYNTLRKLHVADWYIWVHDGTLGGKPWVRERIERRRAE